MSSLTPHSPSALGRFLSALLAFLAPGAVLVGIGVLGASPGGERITGGEWITACVAAIVAAAAVDARALAARALAARPGQVPPPDGQQPTE